MGQFQDILDKIMKVDQEGFNPMTESYSSRIGKLPPDPITTDPPLTAEGITKSFTDLGYEDPLASLITPTGEINPSGLTTAYNRVIDDPAIGIGPNAFVGFLNQNYPQELSTTYFPEAQLRISEEGTLGFPKKERLKAKPTYRFEKTENAKREPVYQRFDEKTGDYISYDTKEAFDKAIENYKSITGFDVTTGKKEE